MVEELLPLLDAGQGPGSAAPRKGYADRAMVLAAANGHQRCVEMLAAHADKARFLDVLRAAAGGGHDGVVEFLLALMPGSAAAASTAALCDAVDGGNRDVLNLLLAYGADLHAALAVRGTHTPSVLHYVAQRPRGQPALDAIRAALLLAAAEQDTIAQRYRVVAIPPLLKHSNSEALGISPERERFPLLDGMSRPLVWEVEYGMCREEVFDWHDCRVVETLAAKVEIRFVTAPRWF